MHTKRIAAIASAAALVALAGCTSSPGESGPDGAEGGEITLTVAYQRTATFFQMDDLMTKAKAEFEELYDGVTIELVPIEAEQDQYFTRLALMNGSAETAPDIIYEDTFQIRSDAAAGYLQPIDEYVTAWEDWDQYSDNVKQAGAGDDGVIYGVSSGTDTRGLYFHKDVFAAAGLPDDWQPENWDDILEAARTIKENVPDVTPLSLYTGQAQGEATSMQGFEMLLYGTQDQLFDDAEQKWVTGSEGFVDALGFYDTVYSEGLGLDMSIALDAAVGGRVANELLPEGTLGIALDGSWLPGSWLAGDNTWPEWEDKMGFAAMPTQNGQAPGFTSMSGGWTLAVGANCENPKEAFDFIAVALNQENSRIFYSEAGQIAVRADVAEDPEYLGFNSSFEFFSSLVEYTHFRPATPDYSQISSNIPVATESVATGQASPEEAAAAYDAALIRIVGEEMTTSGN